MRAGKLTLILDYFTDIHVIRVINCKELLWASRQALNNGSCAVSVECVLIIYEIN